MDFTVSVFQPLRGLRGPTTDQCTEFYGLEQSAADLLRLDMSDLGTFYNFRFDQKWVLTIPRSQETHSTSARQILTQSSILIFLHVRVIHKDTY